MLDKGTDDVLWSVIRMKIDLMVFERRNTPDKELTLVPLKIL
jgi:hypothetical protein